MARAKATPENTGKFQVRVDAVTERMVKELVAVGMFGTTESETCCTILRMWLWENQEKLRQNGVQAVPAQSPPSSRKS